MTQVPEKVLPLRRKEDGWRPDAKRRCLLEQMGYVIGKTIGESTYSKIKEAQSRKLNKKVNFFNDVRKYLKSKK